MKTLGGTVFIDADSEPADAVGADIVDELDRRTIAFAARVYPVVTRTALFVVFFWFGIVKLMGHSEAAGLALALATKTVGASHFHMTIGASGRNSAAPIVGRVSTTSTSRSSAAMSAITTNEYRVVLRQSYGPGNVSSPPKSTYVGGSATPPASTNGPCSPGMYDGDPHNARDAIRPDAKAASTAPPSMPLRVQSPARTMFVYPLSSGRSRYCTVPACVVT